VFVFIFVSVSLINLTSPTLLAILHLCFCYLIHPSFDLTKTLPTASDTDRSYTSNRWTNATSALWIVCLSYPSLVELHHLVIAPATAVNAVTSLPNHWASTTHLVSLQVHTKTSTTPNSTTAIKPISPGLHPNKNLINSVYSVPNRKQTRTKWL